MHAIKLERLLAHEDERASGLLNPDYVEFDPSSLPRAYFLSQGEPSGEMGGRVDFFPAPPHFAMHSSGQSHQCHARFRRRQFRTKIYRTPGKNL